MLMLWLGRWRLKGRRDRVMCRGNGWGEGLIEFECMYFV